MDDKTVENLAYQLFRLMGSWMSRQCYEESPSYSREDLLRDIQTNLKTFADQVSRKESK